MWAYNVKAFFNQYYCGRVNVGDYLSWVPLVGGTLGAVLGGYVSDRLAKSRGTDARMWVLIVSQVWGGGEEGRRGGVEEVRWEEKVESGRGEKRREEMGGRRKFEGKKDVRGN